MFKITLTITSLITVAAGAGAQSEDASQIERTNSQHFLPIASPVQKKTPLTAEFLAFIEDHLPAFTEVEEIPTSDDELAAPIH